MQSSKALADVKRGAKCHRFSSLENQAKNNWKTSFFSQITNGHFLIGISDQRERNQINSLVDTFSTIRVSKKLENLKIYETHNIEFRLCHLRSSHRISPWEISYSFLFHLKIGFLAGFGIIGRKLVCGVCGNFHTATAAPACFSGSPQFDV